MKHADLRCWFVLLLGCRPPQPVVQLGGSQDDGAGDLANASTKLLTQDGSGADPFAPRKRKRDDAALGGTTYGNYVVPEWQNAPDAHRTYPRHQQQPGLGGAIEGAITWRGAVPGKRQTPCGPQQLVQVGPDRGVGDVVILIEQVKVGRMMPTDGHAAQVGGMVVKRGCILRPVAQLVTPLPAALTIHGDAAKVKLRVTPPASAARAIELGEGGRAAVPVELGITRIEAEDGSVAGAWVIGSDAPYFAITDDHGRFRIDELANGTYEVTIWHPPLAIEGTGPIRYGAPIVTKRSVTVAGLKPARLDVAIGR